MESLVKEYLCYAAWERVDLSVFIYLFAKSSSRMGGWWNVEEEARFAVRRQFRLPSFETRPSAHTPAKLWSLAGGTGLTATFACRHAARQSSLPFKF